MASNPEKLTCVSIILCEAVYRDERTKKLVIVGTFNRITAPKLPARHARLTVMLTLTNGRGKYDVDLRIEHERTGHVVAKMQGPMQIDDPLAMNEINVEMVNLVFPDEGKYWISLFSDGEPIAQRPFFVRKPDEGHQQKDAE